MAGNTTCWWSVLVGPFRVASKATWPCPPEDVGGPHGYALFREALGDPDDPEHDHLRGWAGNWFDHFDLATTDLVVRQTVGEVPLRRLLLDLVGEGVT